MDPAYVRSEVSFDERLVRNRAAKAAIAAAASQLVPSGATVLVDAGSTCLEAGKALLGRKDVRLITHSVALLEAAFRVEASILCLGGELRKVSGALTGGPALGALNSIHADIAFVGASGIEPDWGCTTTDLSETEMKRAIIARSGRKMLLADLTKWRNPGTVRFAEWSQFDDWIVDKMPPRDELKAIRASSIKIRQAWYPRRRRLDKRLTNGQESVTSTKSSNPIDFMCYVRCPNVSVMPHDCNMGRSTYTAIKVVSQKN